MNHKIKSKNKPKRIMTSTTNTNNSNNNTKKGLSEIGLYGLAVMGQNVALNIASKGFSISVCNRSPAKVDACTKRAKDENLDDLLTGYKNMKEFILSIKKPRSVIILVKAGPAVESVLNTLLALLEPNDLIIDGGMIFTSISFKYL